jgi:hypothetical protein
MKTEGYWYEGKGSKYPKPVGYRIHWVGQEKFLKHLAKLEAMVEEKGRIHHYRGWSTCRICKCKNGSTEFEFKGWTWPVGFKHYVEEHNVKPSVDFQVFVEDNHGFTVKRMAREHEMARRVRKVKTRSMGRRCGRLM